MKVVCYFSASGVTREVAQKVSSVLNTDLFEIEPVEKYTKEDLDWMNSESRSSIEMKNNIKPKIKEKLQDIDKYNVVIIGFPVWWYKAPTIINTFIEENNLEGKDIYVFVTSGSSSYSDSLINLKSTYPNLNFIQGARFSSNVSEQEILDFLN